jgi:hypothetical protein
MERQVVVLPQFCPVAATKIFLHMGSFPDILRRKIREVSGSGLRGAVTMVFSSPGLTGRIEVSFNQLETLAQQSGYADTRFFGPFLQDLHLAVIDSAGNDELFGVSC